MSGDAGPSLLPMMAVPGGLPDGDGWAFEMKWDGIRVLADVGTDGCRLWSRNARDVSGGYPELLGIAGTVPPDSVLDGEIVALDADGVPSFGLLQRRMHVRDPRQLSRLIGEVPVLVRAFDVLRWDGRSLLDATYDERRALLDSLDLGDPFWETPPSYADGAAALAASIEENLEGVVAKRRASRYLPGRRSSDWVKVKHILTRDVVLCGWHPGEGNRTGRIGSLYCGAYDDSTPAALASGEPELVLIGKVGSGLDTRMLAILGAELAELEIDEPPFDPGTIPAGDRRRAHWLDPVLVAEVAYTGWAADGRLRHPVWRGLRLDITPDSVQR